MKPELHWSHVEALAKCGEAFRFSYLEGRRVRPGIAIGTGSAVHEVAAENLRSKAAGDGLLPLEAVRDAARDAFARQWESGLALLPEEIERGTIQTQGEAIDRTIRLAALHATKLAPAINPKPGGIERAWRVEVDGFPFDLAGEIDVQEVDGTIRDLKTSGKMPNAKIVATSGQLTIYAVAAEALDGQFPERVALDYVVEKGGRESAGSFVSERRPEHVAAFWARLERTAEIIEKAAFTPSRPYVDWWCGPRWCGYARTNPDTGRPYCAFFSEARVFSAGPGFPSAPTTNGGSTNGNRKQSRTISSPADRAAILAAL